MAAGPAGSRGRCCPIRRAPGRQMSPQSRRIPLPMVVHPLGEAEAMAEMGPSPTVRPIRPTQAIIQLPDLGLSLLLAFPLRIALADALWQTLPSTPPPVA